MENYKLETMIDKCYDEFLELEEDRRTPVNMAVVVRKHSPKSIKSCLDILNEHNWILVLDCKAGNQLLDSVIATVYTYMLAVLLDRWEREVQRKAMASAMNETVKLYRP